ncbi:MAG: HNH endonuclease [Oligoflexia bacterium]|nr:HNH endonuclease [Oligoflexia bacterium]
MHLSDSDLVANFGDLIVEERESLVRQLEYLVELDRRKLFYEYSSLRSFLVGQYQMEEWRAEQRVRAARLLKRIPEIKAGLESGKLNFTLLEIAQGCAFREKLSDPELAELLRDLSGMSCSQAEREIARRYPDSVKVPRDRIRPLTETLSEVRFVATEKLLEKLDDVRGLLAHPHPGLSMGELIDVLATEYRERHHPEEKARRAKARVEARTKAKLEEGKKPALKEGQVEMGEQVEMHGKKQLTEVLKTPTAPEVLHRRVPSKPLQHELIWKHGYRCAYVDPSAQKRCQSKHGLQVDHQMPWAFGGKTRLENLRLLCPNHHRRVSFLQFGESARYFRRE